MQASLFFWLPGRCAGYKHGAGLIHRQGLALSNWSTSAAITILQRLLPIRAPIAAINGRGTRITGRQSKGMGMTEQQDSIAQEREEIASRVASFKATQQKFERERDEYFVTTLETARQGSQGFQRPPFWS
jgi:hypothetical protein